MRRQLVLIGAGTIIGLAIPFLVHSQYALTLINVAGVNMLLAIGLLFLFGFCGQLAFCQAAFFGIGAYTSAILSIRAAVDVWLSMAVATMAAGVIAVAIGAAILRLRSHYFALATLGFSQIVSQILLNWKPVTGGTDGIVNIPKPAIGPFVFESTAAFYYLIFAMVALGVLLAYRLRHSKYGRFFIAVRSDALAAEVSGLDVFRIKLLAFVISAVYAGLGGAIYAHMFSFISPDAFDFVVSINVFAMVLIGGTAKIWGVLLGSILVTCLPEVLRFTREYYMLIYGVGIAIVVMFLPGGISGYVQALPSRHARTHSQLEPSDAGEVPHEHSQVQ